MENADRVDIPIAAAVEERHSSLSTQQNIQSPSSVSSSSSPCSSAPLSLLSPSSSTKTTTTTMGSTTANLSITRQASIPCRRRGRLQRSERLQSDGSSQHQSYSSLEALIRDSFGQIVWPIRITSWDLLNSAGAGIPPDLINSRYVHALLEEVINLLVFPSMCKMKVHLRQTGSRLSSLAGLGWYLVGHNLLLQSCMGKWQLLIYNVHRYLWWEISFHCVSIKCICSINLVIIEFGTLQQLSK